MNRGGDATWHQLLVEQIRANGRLFYRLAFGVVRDAEAAEDICQQAFLKAWERRGEIRNGSTLRGWLARVVINDSLQMVRRRRIESNALRFQRPADPRGCPVEALHGMALRQSVLEALAELAEPERLVVGLRLIQGLSGNEVGELLGCSAAMVSRRLHSGMERLRGLLADWAEQDGVAEHRLRAKIQAGES